MTRVPWPSVEILQRDDYIAWLDGRASLSEETRARCQSAFDMLVGGGILYLARDDCIVSVMAQEGFVQREQPTETYDC